METGDTRKNDGISLSDKVNIVLICAILLVVTILLCFYFLLLSVNPVDRLQPSAVATTVRSHAAPLYH